jgi:hypothetical protein
MYDYATGGVCDGLNSDGINCNQGAESVICFLMALSSLNKHIDKPFNLVMQSKLKSEVNDEISDEVTNEVIQKRKNILSANNLE